MEDEFEFRIVGNVREFDCLIRARAGEGSTARLVAGFCWPRSDSDDGDRVVRRGVSAGDFTRYGLGGK